MDGSPGGQGEVLRGSRGEAAGTKPGSSWLCIDYHWPWATHLAVAFAGDCVARPDRLTRLPDPDQHLEPPAEQHAGPIDTPTIGNPDRTRSPGQSTGHSARP